MKIDKRLTIKISGESGMGINSSGEFLAKAIKDSGLYSFGYREYPSVIEGGVASYQIDISDKPIKSSSKYADIMICIDRDSFYYYLPQMKKESLIIHSINKLILKEEDQKFIKDNNVSLEYINTDEILEKNNGIKIMTNIILLGLLTQVINLPKDVFWKRIEKDFDSKKDLIDDNQKLFDEGYKVPLTSKYPSLDINNWNKNDNKDDYIISGNHALALGAINCGVRAYYAYPMTPASSILTFLAETSSKTGILIKQAEDEITAAQMTLGSMFMGTRAFTATSGGGFDLMTETVSLAGITETPMVVVISQRPGPATGLPTWTSAGDLNLALYSGHGEFPRCVIAASDAQDAFELIQHSFNIAEIFQIPVILLTEKQISESIFQIDKFNENIDITRGLSSLDEQLTDVKRYDYHTISNGISNRWLPGTSKEYYKANSDEHDEFGNSTEDAQISELMMKKRLEKLDSLSLNIPEPQLFGDPNASTVFVGWGSVKNVILDTLPDIGFAYLHYSYIYPLKTEKLLQLSQKGSKIVVVENNATSQFSKLVKQETGIEIHDTLLKFDGRPFFTDEILSYITMNKHE